MESGHPRLDRLARRRLEDVEAGLFDPANLIIGNLDVVDHEMSPVPRFEIEDDLRVGEHQRTVFGRDALDGEDAVIAIIDAFSDILVATDYRRHHGFLTGMGIELGDPIIMGDQPMEGEYTGGKGGSYVIACNEAGQAAEPESRTAMENCLSRNPDINVVYAINEPAAFGALSGLKAAGKDDQAVIATIDGGCAAVQSMQSGSAIKATSQQYPLRMASLGMEAIASIARGGEAPEVTEGLDFYNTGVELVTDMPMDGIPSITSDEGAEICWGA